MIFKANLNLFILILSLWAGLFFGFHFFSTFRVREKNLQFFNQILEEKEKLLSGLTNIDSFPNSKKKIIFKYGIKTNKPKAG